MAKNNNAGNQAGENQEGAEVKVTTTQKLYQEWKVDVRPIRDADQKITGHDFEKVKLLKDNIRLDASRIEDLNRQTVNSKIYYYEAE